ncbi:MAG: hypothetical protein QOF82_642 [Frankiales bacterium]|nr:hypothetical protein [Frankiales bacterium]
MADNEIRITPTTTSAAAEVRPRSHGSFPRGLGLVPSSSFTEGRFGRMFRDVPVYEHDMRQLGALAESMIAPIDLKDTEPVVPGAEDEDENPVIPAGFTYLGQFIDHDITFDPASSLQRQNDPDGLHDYRTPRFDLDSVYGRGPADQPYLYQSDGVRMLLGRDLDGGAGRPANGPDLPRNSLGRALTGDPRNDENLIVSQLQSLFLRFHNTMADRLADTGLTGADLFRETQRQVRWHYQWVVVHDFLGRVVDGSDGVAGRTRGVVDDVLRTDVYRTSDGDVRRTRARLEFYAPRVDPFMPVEFSVAAYRFGHSMVRPSYFINDVVKAGRNNARIPLFSLSTGPLDNLNGFRPLPDQWGIQWKYFYDISSAEPAQRSYKIDTQLANPLGALPAAPDMPSLALRNLTRGVRLGLPSGQTIARAMGITPLTDAQLGIDTIAPDYAGDSPLWHYILKEAEVLCGAQHLGPVGGRIVCETLVGLLAGDPLSYLRVEPGWQPELAVNGRFGMAELVAFTEAKVLPTSAPRTPAMAGRGRETS